MKFPFKKIVLAAAVVSSILTIAFIGVWIDSIHRATADLDRVHEFKLLIAQIPLGLTATQTDARIGEAPYRVTETSGVLMNSTTMLTASNSLRHSTGHPKITHCDNGSGTASMQQSHSIPTEKSQAIGPGSK